MSATAYLFPGQGSQLVGMGRDLHERFPEAREVFERADAVLGFGLTDLMFGSEAREAAAAEEALRQTEVTQPALYVHSLAVMAVLRQRLAAGDGMGTPDMAAGHSLGEYSALAAAGAIGFEDGLRIVRLRGELMSRAGDARPGTMAAILGMDDDDVVRLCEAASDGADSIVVAANFNAPGQVVISGSVDAVERAMTLGRDRGARRVVPLSVSGAFHSPLMAYAYEGLASALNELEIRPPRSPVYLNVTGAATTDPDEIRRRLLEQLTAPVRWAQALQAMKTDGATRFVEVGAGRVLSGLVRRTLGREVETIAAGTAEDVEALAPTA